MAKYQVEWSNEARSDLIDILEFYITRNASGIYSKKLSAKIIKSIWSGFAIRGVRKTSEPPHWAAVQASSKSGRDVRPDVSTEKLAFK